MRAAATIYCSACIARLTGLRIQERAKRAHRMHVCCRYPAPFTPLSLLPDLSEAPSQSAAHGSKVSQPGSSSGTDLCISSFTLLFAGPDAASRQSTTSVFHAQPAKLEDVLHTSHAGMAKHLVRRCCWMTHRSGGCWRGCSRCRTPCPAHAARWRGMPSQHSAWPSWAPAALL